MIPLLSGYPLTGRYGYRRRPATHRDLQRIATFCRVGGHASVPLPVQWGTHSFPEGAIALPEFPGLPVIAVIVGFFAQHHRQSRTV
jgi:hypothetical protein